MAISPDSEIHFRVTPQAAEEITNLFQEHLAQFGKINWEQVLEARKLETQDRRTRYSDQNLVDLYGKFVGFNMS